MGAYGEGSARVSAAAGLGGERPPRPVTRLQLDAALLQMLVNQRVLDDLEQQCPAGDRDQLARAAENLARRASDLQLYQRLAAQDFQGPQYEIFTHELAAYGIAVIQAWLYRGTIFGLCAQRGRPLPVTDRARELLAASRDERTELALETVAEGIRLFRTRVLLTGGWSVEGGASLKTFFIGACLYAFANVYRRWYGEKHRWQQINTARYGLTGDLDPTGRQVLDGQIGDDPAATVTSRHEVLDQLAAMPPATREVAARVVLRGDSFAEAAQETRTTERAVEGRLYRYRAELKRRQTQRAERGRS